MMIIEGDGSWGKLLAAGRCPMCTGAIEDNKCRVCRLEIGQGEDMSKSRARKYKSSQEHLNKSLRKVEVRRRRSSCWIKLYPRCKKRRACW